MKEIIGVVGAGVMGHGIAEVFAVSGFQVVLSDISEEFLAGGVEKIKWSLESMSKKGAMKETPEAVLSRISTTTDLGGMSGADYIIEAVREDSETKRMVLEKLDSVAKPDCVFSSNTSTIPISELASMTKRPGKFIGLHFSNPPVMMPLVEIILADRTGNDVLEKTVELVKAIRKEYVIVRKDVPGFLINRLNDRVILESMKMLEEGARKEDLDAMVRFRLDFPMGICELLDFVGIDTVYYANREMGNHGFNTEASPILKEKVETGKTGMKSGEGFYQYPKPNVYARPQILPGSGMYGISPLDFLATAINEAAWIVRNGVATAEDVEKSMKMAMNWPEGPLMLADRLGIDNIVMTLEKKFAGTGKSRYEPDPMLKSMVEKGELGVHTGKGFHHWELRKKKFGPIEYLGTDRYALITINRPERLNALNEDAWEGLRLALEESLGDDNARSVVITGKGRAFSAGDDIDMMDKWKNSMDAKIWMNKFAQPLLDTISAFPKPIISAVNGISFGGGCELNMLFDIVIASDKAVFSLPEGLIGAMPPIGSSYGVALISRKLARYALTGDWLPAAEAEKLGMVDVVVGHDQLQAAIVEFTRKIAKLAPLSVAGIKSSINAIRSTYATHAKSAGDDLLILASSEDFRHGQEAFLRKRKPDWKGR